MESKILKKIISITVTFFFLFGILFFFQPHMDEFVSYNVLAYLNPNYHYNSFIEGYNAHIIHFLGIFSYPRAYAYIGALSSSIFFPFYSIFPFPSSLIIFNTTLYIVFVYCMQRILSLKKSEIGVLIFCLPLTFLYFHDTGPVKLSIISFPLSVILVQRIKLFSNFKLPKLWLYSFILGFLWFLMFEDKVFYLFVFPSVLIFSCVLSDIWEVGDFVKIIPALSIFSLITIGYLFSPTNMNSSYFAEIQSLHIDSFFSVIFKNFIYSLTDFWFYTNHYLILPFSQPIRILIPLSIFMLLRVLFVFYPQLTKTNTNFFIKRKIIGLWLSFFTMTLIFFCTGSVKNGHHYTFLWIPLIVIVLRTKMATNIRLAIQGTIVSMSFFVVLSALFQPTSWYNSRDITKIHHELEKINKDGSSIIVVASWGGYFERNINPETKDIYVYDEGLAQFTQIDRLAKEQKKAILVYFRLESYDAITNTVSKYNYRYEKLNLPNTHEWILLKLLPVYQ